jgi:hypothetical protein
MNVIRLEVKQVAEMRAMLHELANVFTGILISSGLLAQKLDGTGEAGLARDVCDLGGRGSELVRQARALLIEASAT